MTEKRYLTKTRFKLGMECPTKLYYTKKDEYLDKRIDDPFLKALAEGGFQVGELAKCYYKNGHNLTTLDYDKAEAQTAKLLKKKKVTIFEPAIRFKNLFIRVDVLIKDGIKLDLIEVKSKSFDNIEKEPFLNKNGSIKASWKPYLYDIAFQRYVLTHAYPGMKINSFLMMADKNAKCPVDGLNQKFKIVRDETNRTGVKVSNTLNDTDLKKPILAKIAVDDIIDLIMEEGSFEQEIERLANAYKQDKKIKPIIGSHCNKCEFQCSKEEESEGYKSGFKECWKESLGWNDSDFDDSNILEVWSYTKKNQLIKEGRVKIKDLNIDDFEPGTDGNPGLSAKERKWLQVEKVQNGDSSHYLDIEGLRQEMEGFKYPLHFIDFETTMVAIPFNKGRKPYEGIAFQFSHHIVNKDGSIEHAGEYLNSMPGEFPNFDFLRELKKQLSNDDGTIFMYSPHENTFLNHIYKQLKEVNCKLPDKEELCDFIKSITKSTKSSSEVWEGKRCMVDMWHLVKRYYYDPYTRGSNSIKQVLPAVLNSSKFLQKKYSSSIYGSKGGIKSLNFKNWQWVEMQNGKVIDPYTKLPKMFKDISDRDFEILSTDDEIRNGGAALTAYGKMQFTEMSDAERFELRKSLLMYCELDTLAMVMIFEAWNDWVSRDLNKKRRTK